MKSWVALDIIEVISYRSFGCTSIIRVFNFVGRHKIHFHFSWRDVISLVFSPSQSIQYIYVITNI